MSATSTSSVTVRRLSPRDEAALLALARVCHPGWSERPGRFYASENTTLVAEDDGQMIGYAVLGFANGGEHAILHDSGVAPEHRGRGVARQLHEARLAMARERGAAFAVGFTWKGNAPMRRLLKTLGFVQTMTHADWFTDNGTRDRTALVYVKPLN